MDMRKAKEISVLVNQKERYEKIVETLSNGYSDEWMIKNKCTEQNVFLTNEDLENIKYLFKGKLDSTTDKINKLN